MKVYVDGSWNMNVGDHARVGIGIYFDTDYQYKLSIELTQYNTDSWINHHVGELLAIYIVLFLTSCCPELTIYTDSQYCIHHLSDYASNSNNTTWMNSKELTDKSYTIFVSCLDILSCRRESKYITNICKVRAHSGIEGNEIADKLAYAAMLGQSTSSSTNILLNSSSQQICNSVAQCIAISNAYTKLSTVMPKKSSTIKDSPVSMDWNSLGVSSKVNFESKVSNDLQQEKDLKSNNEEEYIEEVGHRVLYLLCIKCTDIVAIKYKHNKHSKQLRKLGITHYCMIAITTCKSCILETADSRDNTSQSIQKYNDSTNKLQLSSKLFIDSPIHKSLNDIEDTTCDFVVESGFLKHISIATISNICNKHFYASTVNLEERHIGTNLQLGFVN